MTGDLAKLAKQPGGTWRIKKSTREDLKPGTYIELEFSAAGLSTYSGGGRLSLTFEFSTVRWENWGGKLALLEVDGSPIELEATSTVMPKAVLDTLLKWREGTSEDEATPSIVVWSYPGRTQADAGAVFAKHAQALAAKGYRPVAQSWAEGRPGMSRILAIGPDIAGLIKPKGFLTVTYQLTEPSVVAPAQPDVIDQLRRLGQLRDSGIVTTEEFERKKADLLERL